MDSSKHIIKTDDIQWRPKNAPEALEALEVLSERLREKDDRRAVFIDVYIVITRRVVNIMRIKDHEGFLDPPWLSELTGRFAEEALVAVLSSIKHQPVRASAWRFANHYAANKLTEPYQDALLGVSAHINYDLGLVVYDFLESRRISANEQQLERYRFDYMRVNKILESSVLACMDLLIERYDCRPTRRLLRLPMSRMLAAFGMMKTLERWRNRVWDNIMKLWHAPDEAARARIIKRMDIRAGRIAQAICASQLPGWWQRGVRPPFRLSRPAPTWPAVDLPTLRERTITDTLLGA